MLKSMFKQVWLGSNADAPHGVVRGSAAEASLVLGVVGVSWVPGLVGRRGAGDLRGTVGKLWGTKVHRTRALGDARSRELASSTTAAGRRATVKTVCNELVSVKRKMYLQFTDCSAAAPSARAACDS